MGLVMYCPCEKFGDCSFSRFSFSVRTNRHTEAAKRFTPANVVGVSNTHTHTKFQCKIAHPSNSGTQR